MKAMVSSLISDSSYSEFGPSQNKFVGTPCIQFYYKRNPLVILIGIRAVAECLAKSESDLTLVSSFSTYYLSNILGILN